MQLEERDLRCRIRSAACPLVEHPSCARCCGVGAARTEVRALFSCETCRSRGLAAPISKPSHLSPVDRESATRDTTPRAHHMAAWNPLARVTGSIVHSQPHVERLLLSGGLGVGTGIIYFIIMRACERGSYFQDPRGGSIGRARNAQARAKSQNLITAAAPAAVPD